MNTQTTTTPAKNNSGVTAQHTILLETTTHNIEMIFKKIIKFANDNNYEIKGNLAVPASIFGKKKTPEFDSKTQNKVARHYLTKLDNRVGMMMANKFLHFIFKHGYKIENIPSLEYSEKELKIRAAKKLWKAVAIEAEKLRLMYKEEKGDFFKKRKV